MAPRSEVIHVAGRDVTVTNPDKVFFAAPDGVDAATAPGDAQTGPRDAATAPVTKLDLVRYYLAVADGALRGTGGRPMALKRYPNGATGPFFFQKRAPESRPAWIPTVTLSFPSGRTADEVVIDDAAQLAWVINLGCIDLNPHPVRADDLDHPDELRVDLERSRHVNVITRCRHRQCERDQDLVRERHEPSLFRARRRSGDLRRRRRSSGS